MDLIFYVVLIYVIVTHWEVVLTVAGIAIAAVIMFSIVFPGILNKGTPEARARKGRRATEPLRISIEVCEVNREAGKGVTYDMSSVRTKKPDDFSLMSLSPPGSRVVPTRGLVIMEEPLAQILSGEKTMELRSKHNRQLGPIALIEKGSGKIYGVAEIVESIGPMSFDKFCSRADEHGVQPHRLREVFDKGWIYGWRLQSVVPLRNPIPYIHKGMSQVKLDPAAIEGLRRELGGT